MLDLTIAWAGPYSTMILADWGAEVLRVESCQVPSPSTRSAERTLRPSRELIREQPMVSHAYPNWDPGDRPWNRTPMFNSHGRNKLSMTVDLRLPQGKEQFFSLVAISDVVIENNPAATMDKLGVSWEALRQANPTLVYLRMPGFGLSGPYREYRALGYHIEGVVGLGWRQGYKDSDPSLRGETVVPDAAAGISGALSILLALRHRRRTGRGQLIEIPQAENFLPFMAGSLLDYTLNGRIGSPMGNRHEWMAPHGCYPCAGTDEWVVLAVGTDEEFGKLCQAIGLPKLAEDSRFADALSRWENQDQLDPLISDWTRERPPKNAAEVLQASGVAAAPVSTEADLLRDPHLQARGFFEPLTHNESGSHLYCGPLWRMASTPNHLRLPPCRLGEHNQYAYKDLLGIDDQKYAELEQAGHISLDYPADIP